MKTINKWLKRAVLILLVMIFAALTMTTIRASVLDGQIVMPLTGSRLVDIGGRNIHFYELGIGNPGPAVVLLPCLGCGSMVWARVQPTLAKTTHTYAFDPAGMQWSDPHPQGSTIENAADDLHTALLTLGEKEIILVAFSGSGITALNFVARHPDVRVAGMVWVEADMPLESGTPAMGSASTLMPDPVQRLMIELGIGRIFYESVISPAQWSDYPTQDDPAFDRTFYQLADRTYAARKTQRTGTGLSTSYEACVKRAATLARPTTIPVFALDADWQSDFEGVSTSKAEKLREKKAALATLWRGFAESTPNGKYIPVAHSSHMIPVDQPHAIISATREMWEMVAERP